jgi:hypothetical protein
MQAIPSLRDEILASLEAVTYQGGLGVQTPRNSEVLQSQTGLQISGKCLVFLFQHPNYFTNC